MSELLSHLNENQIIDLMKRYYAGQSIDKLINEYSLNVSADTIYKEFPPLVFPNYTCEYCGQSLVVNRHSKELIRSVHKESEFYCPSCGHKPFIKKCECSCCEHLNNERRHMIQELYSNLPELVDISNLAFSFKAGGGKVTKDRDGWLAK